MTNERAAELLSDVTVLDDPEMEEAHKMAIHALRQQETVTNRNGLIESVENRCEYCNDPHPARDCIVDGNLEQMLVGRSFSDAYIQTRRIKFCPMCGRELLPEEGTV